MVYAHLQVERNSKYVESLDLKIHADCRFVVVVKWLVTEPAIQVTSKAIAIFSFINHLSAEKSKIFSIMNHIVCESRDLIKITNQLISLWLSYEISFTKKKDMVAER